MTIHKDKYAYDINKKFLEMRFKKAVENKEVLWPDDAIKELMAYWEIVVQKGDIIIPQNEPKLHRITVAAKCMDLHKYAVDLFYKHYFSKTKGASKITKEHHQTILKLHEEGKTHREIAIAVGLSVKTPQDVIRSKDVIRKRIDKAKK